MRILHTADWHLGQTLHGHSRAYEHARFFAWLLDTLEAREVDALVIAGDVFDTANPSAAAQAAYYQLLASARARLPHLDIVVVGGNHDSPDRLDAPRELLALDAIRVHVVGALPRTLEGAIDLERVLVPLHAKGGAIGAWLVAVPFLRRGELPLVGEEEERDAEGAGRRLADAYRGLYRGLVDAALRVRAPGQALVATGHCYMTGGRLSELSERKIQVGNQHALPLEIYPEELAYVALGHLHAAQTVLGRETVRYSGSPIPLSMTERTYEHQVILVELDGERIAPNGIQKLRVPRAVELHAVPEEHAPLPEVLAQLRALPRVGATDEPDEGRPFLEVRVLLDAPSPRLRREVEEALEGAFARLARIDPKLPDRAERHGATTATRDLGALSPEAVFRAVHEKHRGDAPVSTELFALFSELVEEVERGEEPASSTRATREVNLP